MSPDERPLVVVFRTGMASLREYLVRSIAREYRVHMVVGADLDWELAYITGHTTLESSADPRVVLDAVRAVDAREHVSGVVCWDEARIAQTAVVTTEMGLPGPTPDVIAGCRDKWLTRQRLGAGGVPQPRSMRVGDPGSALAAAAELGYPVILKPSDLSSSMGVVRVDDPDDLTAHFGYAYGVQGGLPGYQAQVLLEEYVDGLEISIDAAVYRGRVVPLVLARKELGYPPYCVEVGHTVHAGDPLRDDPELLALLEDAHKALGFTDGITHTEIKLSPDGPKVIEVNGRLGGGMIPYLGLLATGVDTGLAAADVACGREPRTAPDQALVAGIRFFFVAEDETLISSIAFDRDALPPQIDSTAIFVEPGDVRSRPPHGTIEARIAYAIAVADDADGCARALDAAGAALRINVPG